MKIRHYTEPVTETCLIHRIAGQPKMLPVSNTILRCGFYMYWNVWISHTAPAAICHSKRVHSMSAAFPFCGDSWLPHYFGQQWRCAVKQSNKWECSGPCFYLVCCHLSLPQHLWEMVYSYNYSCWPLIQTSCNLPYAIYKKVCSGAVTAVPLLRICWISRFGWEWKRMLAIIAG